MLTTLTLRMACRDVRLWRFVNPVPTTRLDTMLDDTLKDYWTFVLHYRRSGAITRAALLGGFLLHQARHHRSMKVRRLLTAFIAREKGSLDDKQSR